jgi:tetratricopeptide (TPR) repeat protein
MTGRDDESLARSDKGLALLEPYLRAEPGDMEARDYSLKLHGNRAYALGAVGRHREAVTEWTKVFELSPQPVPAGYRIRQAFDLFRADEIDRAWSQADALKPAPGISAEDQYNLGCLYCLFATAAKSDTHASVEERNRRAESRIADALGCLSSAAGLGYFRNPASREYARKDPDLAVLANRDEFRHLTDQDVLKP